MADVDERLKAVQLQKAELELKRLQFQEKVFSSLWDTPAKAVSTAYSGIASGINWIHRHLREILGFTAALFLLAASAIALYSWWEQEQSRKAIAFEDARNEYVRTTCAQPIAAYSSCLAEMGRSVVGTRSCGAERAEESTCRKAAEDTFASR